MADKSRAAVTAGIVLGLLYVVETLLKTGILFLVWPIIGGALASYLYTRKSTASVGAGEGAKLGAQAGAIGGLILILVGAPLTYFVLSAVAGDAAEQQLRQAGLSLPFGSFLLVLMGTLIYAVGGLVIATISGIVAALIFRKS
jgi:hypothetical protein